MTKALIGGIACLALLLTGPRGLAADEVGDLFETPTQEAPIQGSQEKASVLNDLINGRKLLSINFDLYAGGGAYFGYATAPNYSDILGDLDHTTLGTMVLSGTLDLRPFDYLRVHASGELNYPTEWEGAWGFGVNLKDLYLDYQSPGLLSAKMGRFSLAWGNARILAIADLPNRAISVSDLPSSTDILPAWLTGNAPSLWFRMALPLGSFSSTFLSSLPDTVDAGISSMGYGSLNELVIGKTYLSLAGYYRYNLTPRLAASAKTAIKGVDIFMDATASFPSWDNPLFCATTGLYYQTSSGPNIKVTAELRWNGEKPGSTALIQDTVVIGGLSQAVALVWSTVGGAPVSLGGTWYHDWTDGSGAVIPSFSADLAPLISVKAFLPLSYGADGTAYRKYYPSETKGYLAGLGIVFLLKANF